MLDDRKSAQTCLETVISPQAPMDTMGKRYCWARRSELALAQDDPALALDIADRLIASAPGLSPGRVITFLWMLKAETLAALRRREDALSLGHAALENARASGERCLLWRAHARLSRLYRVSGHQEAAERQLSAARALIDELAATIPDETLQYNFRQGASLMLR
jgi:tetratricopeptide (TPR) repeat protein